MTPLKYFNDGRKEGSPSDIFGPEILVKSDFWGGSVKNAGIFLGREKNRVIFWVAKKGLRDFFGYAKNK